MEVASLARIIALMVVFTATFVGLGDSQVELVRRGMRAEEQAMLARAKLAQATRYKEGSHNVHCLEQYEDVAGSAEVYLDDLLLWHNAYVDVHPYANDNDLLIARSEILENLGCWFPQKQAYLDLGLLETEFEDVE